jgi:F420-0:gamma-glutamyl ligase
MTTRATQATPITQSGTCTTRYAAGKEWSRFPVRTRWLEPGDDLTAVLQHDLPAIRRGDTVAVSEKVVVLLTGRSVPLDTIRPGRLARVLARRVRPRPGSCGLSLPHKMQYVQQTVGTPRLLTAAAASVVTRPLGIHGAFYRVAGSVARDIDGGRPPYERLLFPPLAPEAAQRICDELQQVLGIGVAIADLNDYGGTIRAVSTDSVPARTLLDVLADNPLGQRATGTPFVVVRQTQSSQVSSSSVTPGRTKL